jgi:hypothetical protein
MFTTKIGCRGAVMVLLITQDDNFIQSKTKTDVATLMVLNEGLDTIYTKITNA